MTLLVISPDYASHLLPLATLATAWRDAGEPVVVATGPATADIVAEFGFQRAELVLGRGSNPGVIRAEQQPPGEDAALRGFFAATRHGMVATLRYQAEARRTDLLWEPVDRARAVLDVVDRVKPDQVIVDHLAFSARLALDVAGVPYADVVLGHPSALPVGDEVYGYPPAWPAAFTPPESDLAAPAPAVPRGPGRVHRRMERRPARAGTRGHAVGGRVRRARGPAAAELPGGTARPGRTALLPPHAFLGSAVRAEPAADDVRDWLDADDRPVVYVSFGSFLSARGDVLATVLEALRPLGLRVAVATGSATGLPDVPPDWLVRPYLPQVALLHRTAVVVTHGGNNSVTEALTAGVPMVVLPFSTDQFAGAAAIEAAGLGAALDPNAVTSVELGTAVRAVLDGHAPHVARGIGEELRRAPGRDVARAALLGCVH